MKHSISL